MEYPFKLSEIIAGCESGSWLDGALFASECHCVLEKFSDSIKIYGVVDLKSNWRFEKYVD